MTQTFQATIGDSGQLIFNDPTALSKLGLQPQMRVSLVIADSPQTAFGANGQIVIVLQTAKAEVPKTQKVGSDTFKNI